MPRTYKQSAPCLGRVNINKQAFLSPLNHVNKPGTIARKQKFLKRCPQVHRRSETYNRHQEPNRHQELPYRAFTTPKAHRKHAHNGNHRGLLLTKATQTPITMHTKGFHKDRKHTVKVEASQETVDFDAPKNKKKRC